MILLCECLKSRDSDHLQNFVYDKNLINADEYLEKVHEKEFIDVPDYAYDVHTRKGKNMKKTKEEFFKDEQNALTPRVVGLFDDLIE